MIRYVFKGDPVTIKNKQHADPQKIGEALDKIATANQGHLRPKAVVESARNERNPLHKFFEWDNAVAAEAFRLDQARNLIRSIHIVSDERKTPTAAFISIADRDGTSYRTLSDVLDSASLQARALEQAERDLLAFEKRFKMFEDICDALRHAREKIHTKRTGMEKENRASA